ncbi:MAG: hypothetical protein ACUVQP_10230, partial [Bacteroidales bacterium]
NKTSIDIQHIKANPDRIYRFIDSSEIYANFIPASSAKVIFHMDKKKQKENNISLPIQDEYGVGNSLSKSENSIDKIQIKSHCIKLKVDRLGNISLG